MKNATAGMKPCPTLGRASQKELLAVRDVARPRGYCRPLSSTTSSLLGPHTTSNLLPSRDQRKSLTSPDPKCVIRLGSPPARGFSQRKPGIWLAAVIKRASQEISIRRNSQCHQHAFPKCTPIYRIHR